MIKLKSIHTFEFEYDMICIHIVLLAMKSNQISKSYQHQSIESCIHLNDFVVYNIHYILQFVF